MNNTSDYSNRREDLFIYLFIYFFSVAGKFFFFFNFILFLNFKIFFLCIQFSAAWFWCVWLWILGFILFVVHSTSQIHGKFSPIIYIHMNLPGGTNGKEPACQCRRHKRHRFDPWVGKILWRRKWQPTPVFLSGESHGQRSLVGYGS